MIWGYDTTGSSGIDGGAYTEGSSLLRVVEPLPYCADISNVTLTSSLDTLQGIFTALLPSTAGSATLSVFKNGVEIVARRQILNSAITEIFDISGRETIDVFIEEGISGCKYNWTLNDIPLLQYSVSTNASGQYELYWNKSPLTTADNVIFTPNYDSATWKIDGHTITEVGGKTAVITNQLLRMYTNKTNPDLTVEVDGVEIVRQPISVDNSEYTAALYGEYVQSGEDIVLNISEIYDAPDGYIVYRYDTEGNLLPNGEPFGSVILELSMLNKEFTAVVVVAGTTPRDNISDYDPLSIYKIETLKVIALDNEPFINNGYYEISTVLHKVSGLTKSYVFPITPDMTVDNVVGYEAPLPKHDRYAEDYVLVGQNLVLSEDDNNSYATVTDSTGLVTRYVLDNLIIKTATPN